MKLYELHGPVAAFREMEDLNAQMVVATGEYRALRTPEALKKITDLNVKIQKILAARGKEYGSIYEMLDSEIELEQIEDNSKHTQWVLRTGKSTIIFEVRWFGSKRDVADFYFKDTDSGYNLNGKGGELKVFAACKQILEWVVKEHSPGSITMEADKSEGNGARDQLYRRLLKRWTPSGYEFSEITDDHTANFFLRKKKA
jgi:mRNA-degrading endonuclease RelE of RelBE toxin-antitoxin system